MVATELSDVMFGTPQPVVSTVNLGALRPECVNIALHGHNPLLSDVIMQAAEDPELVSLAMEKGAEGINLVGLCCTGNELQMRKGIPMAGNHLMQELVILTGALDAMVVDYQCIMPAVTDVAKCFHTAVISTADKAKFTGATHISFDPHRGLEIGTEIVRKGIEAYANRNPERVRIPEGTVEMMAGFSVEAILGALGGTPEPLVEAIKAGKIRGAVGVVGCNNPKVKQDSGHVNLTKRLIENDILVLVTGCSAVANGKAGLMMPEAAEMAGSSASPPTSVRISQSRLTLGGRLPSISATNGATSSDSMACFMPSNVACRMFSRSMSAGEISATDQHRARSITRSYSQSRVPGSSFLESSRPSIGRDGSRITAAATTGPARGPRPASSTPAIGPFTASLPAGSRPNRRHGLLRHSAIRRAGR